MQSGFENVFLNCKVGTLYSESGYIIHATSETANKIIETEALSQAAHQMPNAGRYWYWYSPIDCLFLNISTFFAHPVQRVKINQE